MAIKVFHFPSSPSQRKGIYISNLLKGLSEQGIETVLPESEAGNFLSRKWLKLERGEIDILHFHWTHYHYTGETIGGSVLELCKFILKLIFARYYGYKIIWTMHNYLPHERTYPRLHYIERFCMARLAHRIIVHCDHGRILLKRKLFRRKNVTIIPLASFNVDVTQIEKEMARSNLGIPQENTCFIFFGSIRPYKGISDLIHAFKSLTSAKISLLIVGQPLNLELEQELIQQISTDPRIYAKFQFVTDDELGLWIAAADIAVFPYKEILTSGATITALSYGLPVVAPALGCLPDLIDTNVGWLYDPKVTDALASKMQEAISKDRTDRGSLARQKANALSWDKMIYDIKQVYNKTL